MCETGETGREMGVLAALDRQGERSWCELDWRDREREWSVSWTGETGREIAV